MKKGKIFRFTCEYLVRAKDQEKAEKEVMEEFGYDVYESHILCNEIKDIGQEVDLDLIS